MQKTDLFQNGILNHLDRVTSAPSPCHTLFMVKKIAERKLSNPEAHERINYLLHLATSSILTVYTKLLSQNEGKKFLTPSVVKKEMKGIIGLVQVYVKTIREVAKKSVIRL